MIDWALYVVGSVCGVALLWRLPSPPVCRRAPVPLAIIIPARNEAARIGPLLASLPPQLAPGDEAVVVDDHSTDETASLVRAAGIRVVAAPDLPEGWLGKPHACATGAASTSAERLVFVDADVEVLPGALDWLRSSSSTITSAQPFHVMERMYERLSLFPNIVGLMASGACTPIGRRARTKVAFGPVLAIDRSAYDAVGGHAAVRDRFDEDAGLARLIGDVALVAGRQAPARFRMYPEGLGSLVEGWTKILRPGISAAPWWATVGAGAWITSLAGGWAVHPLCVLASAVQVLWMGRRVGRYGAVTALLYAIPLVCFVLLVLRSLLTRHPSWRGRAT
jgi:4,4'-diaponeurosporenoate glycosyltransferase